MINLGFITGSSELIDALSKTLMHSLWQGLLLAALAGLVIATTRQTNAVKRYNALLFLICLFACCVCFTFISLLNANVSQAQISEYGTGSEPVPLYPAPFADSPAFFSRILNYLHQYDTQIVLVWLVFVCLRATQLMIGLRNLQVLRRTVVPVVAHWQQRIASLGNKLGIRRRVTLVESQLAKMPLMIGYLKPVILIPVGMLNAMTAAEINAILIHELAHIRRRDYPINILQSVLEIFLFFNPGFMWVSALLRTERENCCDDTVLQFENDRSQYIRALVACQEFSSRSSLVMALEGTKGSLLSRINRMLSGRNSSIGSLERIVLVLCIVISAVIGSAFAGKEKINNEAPSIDVRSKELTKADVEAVKPNGHLSTALTHSARQKNPMPQAKHQKPMRTGKDTIVKPASDTTIKLQPAPSAQAKPRPVVRVNSTSIRSDSLKNDVNVNISSDVKLDYSFKYNQNSNRNDKGEHQFSSSDSLYKKPVRIQLQPKVKIERSSPMVDMASELQSLNITFNQSNFTVLVNNIELVVDGTRQPEDKHKCILSQYQKRPGDKVDIKLSYTNSNK